MSVRAILVWMRLLPMMRMWISASPREPRYCIFQTAWMLRIGFISFLVLDIYVTCKCLYGPKKILLGDPPSAAVDRTESSGFRQCEPSPSWKQWIAIVFFSEITAIFLGTVAKVFTYLLFLNFQRMYSVLEMKLFLEIYFQME